MKSGAKELLLMLLAFSLVAIVVHATSAPRAVDTAEAETVTRNNSADGMDSVTAEGGNVTHLNITSKYQSTSWAIFWGQIRAQFVLEGVRLTDNNTNYKIYNWSGMNGGMTGYVFFTNDSSTQWDDLQEANNADKNAEDNFLGLTGGDNVSMTFTQHSPADVDIDDNAAGVLSAANLPSVNTSGYTVGQAWTTLFMTAPATGSKVYAAVVDSGNVNYANQAADYQAMVPVSAATKTRTYWVFAALD